SVEDAGAATNDGAALTGNPIGEAEAWTKVVEVSRKRAGRNPIHPGEGDDTGSAGHRVDRKRVEGVHFVVGFLARILHFPAETRVDGQAIGDAPIILQEEAQIRSA